jgi:hypothetical protein
VNRSTPLSADARRLLELGSQVEPPTAEQDERMGRALAPLFRTGRTGPASTTGSPIGAEPRSMSPRGPIHVTAGEHERSGIRWRVTPRAATRWLEPLRSLEPLKDAKLWLTLGALAATASASFWLGRLSTPAELAPTELAGAKLAGAELAAAEHESPLDARGAANRFAPAAGAAPAIASASWAASLLDAPDRAVSSVTPSVPEAASSARAAVHAPLLDTMPGDTALPDTPLPDTALPDTLLPSHPRPSQPLPSNEPNLRRGTRGRPLGLAAEIEQLARAEAALRQGRPARALRVLEQRSVQHLVEQAAALRAIAECELGVATASRSKRDVLERWPASAFQARIARACPP